MKPAFPALALFPLLLLLAAPLAPAQEGTGEKPTRKKGTGAAAAPAAGDSSAAASASATPAPSPSASIAPNPLGIDEPGQIAAAFFKLLEKNQVDEAYANLTKGSKIGERPEDLRNLKGKTNEAIDLFGTIRGYEIVETKLVGQSLLRRTYMSLGKDFPLRWRFYFYKTANQWRLVDLHVDDRLGGFFDEPEEARTPEPPKAP